MTDNEGVRLRLREARQALNHTQETWAELLGVSRSQVIDVERGRQRPPQEMLHAATVKGKLNPTWLLTGGGSMLDAKGSSKSTPLAASALQHIMLRLAPINVRDEVKRRAAQWLLAVDLQDAAALRSLAEEVSLAHLQEPQARYAPALPDSEQLANALVLAEQLLMEIGDPSEMDSMRKARLACAIYGLGKNPDRQIAASIVRAAVL